MALEITNLRVISAEGEKEARPRPGSLDPQDQGHRNPADADRAQMQALGHYALPYMHEALMPPGPAIP
jgi:hypothetical protein